MFFFLYAYVVFPCNYTIQANLDNGTAGGMSTRGFINTGNFTWLLHKDI